ncbi:methyltransferase domain-containing protein [Mycolicibacterium sp. ND9-15]|uniref:methyltransferase domain-containing protein n=1 Tax=Mycolicibacterium sp. ND9-15 TaxID=3042320 RepID=UPI002DDC7E8A|nr:methyltransferase domain-containing protein [Mycolicibacterium sp. ND9-15]WSE58123.1 methyltransferase domain-containing protein [Mycolicibacterium sp. ND9-15]
MWNPDVYLAFADERGRPFFELLSRVDADAPRRVVDLGCGPGNLTAGLAQRWPQATIEALDNSPEMVAAARFPFHEGQVADPTGYANLLTDAGCTVDAWETTYVHVLTGDNPVLGWITGTALRPVRGRLSDSEWEEFRAELRPLLDSAYPKRTDGKTFFPFRRIFVAARVG